MSRLQKTKGGITTLASRSIYAVMIRAIFICVSQIWHRPTEGQDYDQGYTEMKRLEYQALRRIMGPYNGSNYLTLAGIAGIEPLERKLGDTSIS